MNPLPYREVERKLKAAGFDIVSQKVVILSSPKLPAQAREPL
jgi:hypothetical protein